MSANLLQRLGACCLLLMGLLSQGQAASFWKQDVVYLVGDAYVVGEILTDMPVFPLFVANPAQPDAKPELKAYAFESIDFATVRGYSGKPLNIFIVMDLSGNFLQIKLMDHKEPLFTRLDDNARLAAFAARHKGLSLRHSIQVGTVYDTTTHDEQSALLQGVNRGTISAKAASRTILTAAANVALSKLKIDVPDHIENKPVPTETKTPVAVEPVSQAHAADVPAVASDTAKLSEPSKTPDAGKSLSDSPVAAAHAQTLTTEAVQTKAAEPVAQAETDSRPGDQALAPAPLQAGISNAQILASLQPDEPDWVSQWKLRQNEIAILLAGLALLSVALFAQKRFSANARWLRVLRTTYLLFTLGFIGWYAQGQLTIVNITAAIESLASGDDLSFLMNDPISVILWLFVGVTLLIWGRGTFCGWLCPFGALQELISLLSNAIGLRQRRVRAALDAKLKWIKYGVLAVIIVSLFVAPNFAGWAVEIEPFKTAISLYFMRAWPYVLWAVACLALTVFTYRGYCRYICPLGAALASVNFLSRWAWIPRRSSCGTPCQTCRHRCEYQAIDQSGKINYRECFQCLDCVSIYQDDHRCLPLIQQRKQGMTVIAIKRVMEPQ